MSDEKTLTYKLEAFMEQMATRQQALKEQVAILSFSVQKIMKGDSKKNNEEQGSNGGQEKEFRLATCNSIIPTTKSIAKGGGQTTDFTGNNGKIGSFAPFIKRLTQTEMAERRAKGLCYNCDESYSMGHKCKRLFWIEEPYVEGKQDDDEIDDFR
ncbi:hypothetical protein J1N35_040696 [Gossypium stocksii]|uniref:Uncharacterized protein n=1 Tax=Gossypium stocksii TaxID=47602 RepID=A0A9D3ZIR5_9ROSI|nr:hypothetical protein J1N35_040696 [Gossypium stocksii]